MADRKSEVVGGAAAAKLGMQTLRAGVGGSPYPVVLADINGAIVYANPSFYELQGDDGLQIRPTSLASLSGISHEAVEDLWRRLRRGESWRRQFHDRNGRTENCRCCSSVSPLRNAHGAVTHILACHVDCGNHDLGENSLRSGRERAEVARLGKGWFVTVLDRDERVVFNGVAQPGISNADMVGASFRDYFPPDQAEICAARVANVFRAGRIETYQILAAGAHGNVSHYACWLAPLSSGSQVIAVVLLSREVGTQDTNGEAGMITSVARNRTDTFRLTARELEVLELLVRGLSNSEIGDQLEISSRTAERHLDNIFGKLGVTNRTSAAYLALREELLPRI